MSARAKYLADHETSASRSFARHEIAEESEEGRWLLQDPNSSNCWTEIICVRGGGLYVDGDIEPVVFRYGPKHPIARVHWMGRCPHAWDTYFQEKATIGTGTRGSGSVLSTFAYRIAVADLAEYRDESESDDKKAALQEIIEDVNDETRAHDVGRALYEAGHDLWELSGHVGIVPSTRMFSVHAALQRLSRLLHAKEEADGR